MNIGFTNTTWLTKTFFDKNLKKYNIEEITFYKTNYTEEDVSLLNFLTLKGIKLSIFHQCGIKQNKFADVAISFPCESKELEKQYKEVLYINKTISLLEPLYMTNQSFTTFSVPNLLYIDEYKDTQFFQIIKLLKNTKIYAMLNSEQEFKTFFALKNSAETIHSWMLTLIVILIF
jgi:hypothetical protein